MGNLTIIEINSRVKNMKLTEEDRKTGETANSIASR